MPLQADQDAFEHAILRFDESQERQDQRELQYTYLGPVAPNKIQQLRLSLNKEMRVVDGRRQWVRYISLRWWLQRRDLSWHASRVEIKMDQKEALAILAALGAALDVFSVDELELNDL